MEYFSDHNTHLAGRIAGRLAGRLASWLKNETKSYEFYAILP